METGNKPSLSSLIRVGEYLQPDNETELSETNQISFVDISRDSIEVLRTNSQNKAVAFASFNYPRCLADDRLLNSIAGVTCLDEFESIIQSSTVKYSYSDSKVAIIPEALFSNESSEANFNLLFGPGQRPQICSQTLATKGSVGIYGIPKGLEDQIGSPLKSSFLNWVDSLSPQTGNRINCVISQQEFALVISTGDKVIFSNWFKYEKAEDVVYFLMATLETQNILHSEVDLILSGNVKKGDDVYVALSRFISKITFETRPNNLQYSYSFKQLDEHLSPFIFASACA